MSGALVVGMPPSPSAFAVSGDAAVSRGIGNNG